MGLIDEMDLVRELCSVGYRMRKEIDIPVIQPMPELVWYGTREYWGMPFNQYSHIVQEALNIKKVYKEIIFRGDYEKFNITVSYGFDYKAGGAIYGKETQAIGARVKAGDINGIPEELLSKRITVDNEKNLERNYWVSLFCGGFLVLDLVIPPKLYLERKAQEIIKEINAARKQEGLNVSDTVHVLIACNKDYFVASELFYDLIMKNGKCTFDIVQDDKKELTVSILKEANINGDSN